MTNEQILVKLKEDMEMQGFSHHTKDSYNRKIKEIVNYFLKPMEKIEMKELRDFFMKEETMDKKTVGI